MVSETGQTAEMARTDSQVLTRSSVPYHFTSLYITIAPIFHNFHVLELIAERNIKTIKKFLIFAVQNLKKQIILTIAI